MSWCWRFLSWVEVVVRRPSGVLKLSSKILRRQAKSLYHILKEPVWIFCSAASAEVNAANGHGVEFYRSFACYSWCLQHSSTYLYWQHVNSGWWVFRSIIQCFRGQAGVLDVSELGAQEKHPHPSSIAHAAHTITHIFSLTWLPACLRSDGVISVQTDDK